MVARMGPDCFARQAKVLENLLYALFSKISRHVQAHTMSKMMSIAFGKLSMTLTKAVRTPVLMLCLALTRMDILTP